MRNIRLYIGGQRADLDGGLNIPFTYQTSDAQMPTAVKNSYSKTVTLQGTERNRRLFGGIWRLDSRIVTEIPGTPGTPAVYAPWNQVFYGSSIDGGGSSGSSTGVSVTDNGDYWSITRNASGRQWYAYCLQNASSVVGHKIYYSIYYRRSVAGAGTARLTVYGTAVNVQATTSGSWLHRHGIITASSVTTANRRIYWNNSASDVGRTLDLRKDILVCDLTDIYGEGNEPTEAEFLADIEDFAGRYDYAAIGSQREVTPAEPGTPPQTGDIGIFFNPMKRVPFQLYVDEMVVERGYCQLTAVSRKGRGYTFSLSLFGGLGEFFYNLQTDSDGETRSLADLDFGQDLGFTINAAKVQEVWDAMIAGSLPAIGFVPMHNGAPSSVDAKKALISGGGLPGSVVDGSDTYSQKLGYVLASLERKYTEWEIGDLRSYLQRPALRFKDFLAAVCNPANNGGWTVNLDSDFFNDNNPYYERTYILLPQLNVEESTDEICDDGSVAALSDYPATSTKVQTLQPASSCLTIDGTYVDLSGQASNAYLKLTLPLQLAVTGLASQGDLYLTNRVSHHTENRTICMMAAAYDEGGNLLAVSSRYVFTSKSHRNETGDVKKPAAPVATSDAQIDGYFTWKNGEYVFRSDDNTADTFALVLDKIPRPSSSAHQVQVRFYIQMTTDGIPTLNTRRKGENSSNVAVSNTQFSCRILAGSNNNLSLVEPTQYASDSEVTQAALLNSLEQSPLEILLSYTKTFGLMWVQDNLENSVSLFRRENYYTGEVSDIHDRVDYSKGWKAAPVTAESNNYTLESEYPETTLSKAYESDYGRTYGGVRLKVGYDFGKDKIEMMEKVELKGYVEGALSGSGYWKYRNADGNLPSPIADGMKVTYYKDSGGETKTKDVEYNLFNVTAITKTNSPALGVACLNDDGEEKAVEVAPALVMLQGGTMDAAAYLSDDVAAMATLNNGPCWIWDESRAVARIPRFARVATFDGETYSLDFGTPRMTYYIPEVSLAPEQAVYARFWESYLSDLLGRNTKKVECYVVFPPHLDMRQEMRKFYLFDRTLWVLNKVTDYDATKEASVKCEFIRVNLKGNYIIEQ